MDADIDSALRLAAALVIGALIGLNRDLYGKPTGVRLHALVAMGAALFVMAGESLNVAPALGQIIQGIIGGIGFLGAGVIVRGAMPGSVLHMTTAALIWMTAALGVVCGLGQWRLAALGTGAALIVLVAGLHIDRALYGRFGPEDDLPDRKTEV